MNYNKKTTLLIEFTLLGVCVIFLFLERSRVAIHHSAFFSLLMVPVIILYLYIEYKKSPSHLFVYFFQVYYFFGMMISSIIIGTGIFIIEIQEFGNQNGSFWVLILFFITGMMASKYGFSIGNRICKKTINPHFKIKLEKLLIFGIIALTILSSFYIFIKYSGPISLGIDRVTFWKSVVPEHLQIVKSLITQTFFFVIAIYWIGQKNNKSKRTFISILILYILITIFVLGEKASAFILYLLMTFIFLSGHTNNFKINKKIILLSLCGIGAVSILIIINYRMTGYNDGFVIARIALQSQVLWSVLHSPTLPVLPSAYLACFAGCSNFIDAKDYISYLYLPRYLYDFYRDAGSSLSGFMPAIQILFLGIYGALAAHIVMSIIMGLIAAFLVNQLRYNNIICGFFLFKIYFTLILYWYTANDTAIYGLNFLLSVIIVFLMFIMSYGQRLRVSALIST